MFSQEAQSLKFEKLSKNIRDYLTSKYCEVFRHNRELKIYLHKNGTG